MNAPRAGQGRPAPRGGSSRPAEPDRLESRSLEGRHAFVTGAGRGIGAAIARALARDGATLTLAGRTPASLAQLEGELRDLTTVQSVPLDVTDAASVDRAFAAARESQGPIAILVNNAGAAESAPFARTDDALWHRMLAVNATGAMRCARAALPDMLAAKRGRIVNVASTAGLKGYAYVSAYVAAKHAMVGLTRALALELATKAITVNAVCPGFTETDLLKDSVDTIVKQTGRSVDEARAELAKTNPQRRFVQPDEVAAAVAWLCSDAARSVTGQSISVSGGETT